MKYLALLRSINVGGNNVIKKDELKKCFEDSGFKNVITYIQSGNILFTSKEKSLDKIQLAIEKELEKKLGKRIITLVLREEDYRKTIKSAPKNWGENQKERHNALFILEGKKAEKLTKTLPEINNEFEKTKITEKAIFWSSSKEHYNKTTYNKKLVKSPSYKLVTIRNSNTCFKLLSLFDDLP
jgi:uncharacterized protein (DUF1697 family)